MPATVLGGLFPNNGVSTLTTIETTSSPRRRVAQYLGDKSTRGLRAIAKALNGAAAGGAALATNARVDSNQDLSGKRLIETETLVNRVTVAGDVTILNNNLFALTTRTTFGATPPANLDGNPLGTR